MTVRLRSLAYVLTLVAWPPATAEEGPRPACAPCAGIEVSDPAAVAALLASSPSLADEAFLAVAWRSPGLAQEEAGIARTLAAAGATPWVRVEFEAPAPILEHVEALDREIGAYVELVHALDGPIFVEVGWKPATGDEENADPRAYSFLLKRVSVAIAGASQRARVIAAPPAQDAAYLGALYAEEIAAYVDGVALRAASPQELAESASRLQRLDPGKLLAVVGVPLPEPAAAALTVAARHLEHDILLTLFRTGEPSAATLAPLKVLANELSGPVSLDPYTRPEGIDAAWSVVRAPDLDLRVIVEADRESPEVLLRFSDATLRRPERVDLTTGEARSLPGPWPIQGGTELRVPDPGPVSLLRLQRPDIGELEGVAEELVVRGERAVPVEEILRRLQAFEDAQRRRLDHFQAVNTTHMRFQIGSGLGTFELTLEGDFFFRQGAGFDWAWQRLFLNGIRWRGRSLPEIPLIQPEKAAAMPLEIHFSRAYRYRLRGTDQVEGRDCWVVDFEPAGTAETGETLYRGTVWVDRELFARLRSRAVQLGLEGEVLSNEEVIEYRPVGPTGKPAPWSADSHWLPASVRSQQIVSVLNATSVVERETKLSSIRINHPDFETEWRHVLASDATMVRDTGRGLRYLVRSGREGEREVQEGFRSSRLFAVGGIYYEKALEFPLPLAGVNYFSFDFRGSGQQVNLVFGGVLLNATVSNPALFGSRFDVGADLFAIAFPFGDPLYRDGSEIADEKVEVLPARLALKLGHPVGHFGKLGLSYRLGYSRFRDANETAPEFTVPATHFDHSLAADLRFSRQGYRLGLTGSVHQRSRWDPWGFPGNPDFDPDKRRYVKWEITAAKAWHLPRFQRLGLEANLLGGSDLDRFSKYQFGFFGASRVRGYPTNLVRAARVEALHGSYGLDIGQLFRLSLAADAAWATDRQTGLDRELLAGAGVAGSFMGPWETFVQLDVGVPLAGPADGFVAYLAVLKLLR